MWRFRIPSCLGAMLVLAVLAAPAAARDGTQVHVVGKGLARFTSSGDGAEFATVLRRGTARLIGDRPTALQLVCVNPRRRRCARLNRATQTWIVTYPVRFLYEGTDFTLAVRSNVGFDVGIAGAGRLLLQGKGHYIMNGATTAYNRAARLRLR